MEGLTVVQLIITEESSLVEDCEQQTFLELDLCMPPAGWRKEEIWPQQLL